MPIMDSPAGGKGPEQGAGSPERKFQGRGVWGGSRQKSTARPIRKEGFHEQSNQGKNKFYYLDNDDHDPCIPFEEIVAEVKRLGYKGYIASEYEGHHFDETIDSEEQLRHFVALMTKNLEK